MRQSHGGETALRMEASRLLYDQLYGYEQEKEGGRAVAVQRCLTETAQTASRRGRDGSPLASLAHHLPWEQTAKLGKKSSEPTKPTTSKGPAMFFWGPRAHPLAPPASRIQGRHTHTLRYTNRKFRTRGGARRCLRGCGWGCLETHGGRSYADG